MNSYNSPHTYSRPTHEEIALRAHQLWLEHGCPMGHEVDNWLEAERQLTSEYANRTGADIAQRPAGTMPRAEDVPLAGSDSPTAAMEAHTKLGGKVQDQLMDPSRPESRRSKTSVDL